MQMKRFFTPIRSGLNTGWSTAQKWVASGSLRRVRALAFQIYLLIALVGFSGLALLATTMPVFQPDISVTLLLQTALPGWFGWVMIWVSWLGFSIQGMVITALAVVLLSMAGLRWEAVNALLSSIGSVGLNYMIKMAIRRPRPDAGVVDVFQVLNSYSFPSGHTMFFIAFFGFLLFLAFTLLRNTWKRWISIIILALLIGLVGISRIYLGEHWASDVLGGYLMGSLVLFLCIAIYRWGKGKFFVTQPVAGEFSDAGMTPDELDEIRQAVKNPLIPTKQIEKEIKGPAKTYTTKS
jgi:undecaprenyl-diphosphatase